MRLSRNFSECTTLKMVFYICAVSMLASMVVAQTFAEDKKSDPNNRPFYMGSRYGRSGGNNSPSGGSSKVMVAPRTDRFFMGSRYGKRSNEALNPTSGEELDEDLVGGTKGQEKIMKCVYTGLANFYRCFDRFTDSQF